MIFVLTLISFVLTAYFILAYLKQTSHLLQIVQQQEPELWEQLGRPEHTVVNTGNSTMRTISPLWPWLQWVWSHDTARVKHPSTGTALSNVSSLLRRSLLLFGVTCILILTLASGSGGNNPRDVDGKAPYLGVMEDISYAGLRTGDHSVSRLNANNEPATMDDFASRFIWAEYSAPWCSPCIPQAKAIGVLQDSYDDLVFITIMTGASALYNDLPTVDLAADWASRFDLYPEHVLVAKNLWSRTVPHHILFSPDGHTLFKHTGLMQTADIRGTYERYRNDWRAWKEDGIRAAWMR